MNIVIPDTDKKLSYRRETRATRMSVGIFAYCFTNNACQPKEDFQQLPRFIPLPA